MGQGGSLGALTLGSTASAPVTIHKARKTISSNLGVRIPEAWSPTFFHMSLKNAIWHHKNGDKMRSTEVEGHFIAPKNKWNVAGAASASCIDVAGFDMR